jgi:LmbE family N-acetylglucosaminyl deacetylase
MNALCGNQIVEMLDRLCALGEDTNLEKPRVLLIAAHPDDEIIGAGIRLSHLREHATIWHVTQGAPPDMRDALAAGYNSAADYAVARRNEAFAALSLLAIEQEQTLNLGYVDQSLAGNLVSLVFRLVDFFHEVKPEVILTHPYEGGHPDHDAIALAVRAAACLMERSGNSLPPLLEMTSYHLGSDGLESGCFLPADVPSRILALSDSEQQLKRRLLSCFHSQQHVLCWFRTDVEAFRVGPEYDFDRPPAPGGLFYEQFKIGCSGEQWRKSALAALRHFGLPSRL